MKNAINYYYNLYPENIYTTSRQHYFFIGKTRYSLVKYDDDLSEINKIYSMHLNLLSKNIYVHEIVLNIEKKPVTIVNETPYILLRTLYYDGKIGLNNVVSFSNILETREKKNWTKIWSDKNDYLEFQISELGKKHPIIRESFSYYIGLAETAIALTNEVQNNEITYVYSHKRINRDDTLLEFYNPLNITVDARVRDIAEYLKSSFFNDFDIREELYYYLNNASLTKSEVIMFLARMLYPTYYFDLYEEIITGREKDEKLTHVIEKNKDYEKLLKEIYRAVKNYIGNIQIEWLQ